MNVPFNHNFSISEINKPVTSAISSMVNLPKLFKALAEVLVHELGHIFETNNSDHVDKHIIFPNGCTTESCIMSYQTSANVQERFDSITKFDIETDGCTYDIRKSTNPR